MPLVEHCIVFSSFVPYFYGHCVVWIVDLVFDMCDHVFHKLRLVDEACTIPS